MAERDGRGSAPGSVVLVYVIASVGALTAASTLVGLHTNTAAIFNLRRRFLDHETALLRSGADLDPTDAPPVGISDEELSTRGRLSSNTSYWWFKFFYPWRFIPRLLIASWAVVMIVAPFAHLESDAQR
jgi:hypothetical protein